MVDLFKNATSVRVASEVTSLEPGGVSEPQEPRWNLQRGTSVLWNLSYALRGSLFRGSSLGTTLKRAIVFIFMYKNDFISAVCLYKLFQQFIHWLYNL